MKIIDMPRGKGKTTRLLYASEWNNIPILVQDKKSEEQLLCNAKTLALQIPHPICVTDLLNGKYKQADIKEIYIDDSLDVLSEIMKQLGLTVNALAF